MNGILYNIWKYAVNYKYLSPKRIRRQRFRCSSLAELPSVKRVKRRVERIKKLLKQQSLEIEF